MMEPHDFLDDDLRDTAALFVLESLDVESARAYRLHLPHCDVCRGEVESLARTSRDLALLAPAEEPPPALWNRVLERIRRTDPRTRPDAEPAPRANTPRSNPTRSNATAGNPSRSGGSHELDPDGTQVWKAWTPSVPQDFTFMGGDDASSFEPTAIEGIEARKLFVDVENDRVTMIVRMKPGTAYPGHVHGAAEECFVISGELRVGDRTLRAGDYQRAETGSVHAVQSTETGCVLFLVSSLHDELT